ncbi:hypothetical protein NQ315_003260 [Exocentrus adspersus]|uniref:Uncharacterized protein n=1 Tax=Exocentrus adspersus TaxID=1586481 RepID=A0AAV8VDS1_9CUCU|nr:hypothetical protein NQ315_003260 [Exocentrus adspersus]
MVKVPIPFKIGCISTGTPDTAKCEIDPLEILQYIFCDEDSENVQTKMLAFHERKNVCGCEKNVSGMVELGYRWNIE